MICWPDRLDNLLMGTSYDRGKASEDDRLESASPGSPTSTQSDSTFRVAEDDETSEVGSVIRLQNGMVLYLREINKYVSRTMNSTAYANQSTRFLCLICLMRKESIDKQGLVDYNVQIFQNALRRVFEVGGAGIR